LPQDPAVRASDEDRERVVATLKEHCAAGRLTLEELPDRVERAYAATTVEELAQLTGDLPGRLPPRREPSPAPAPKPPRMPGVAPFSETIEVDRPVAAVETAVLRQLAPLLARTGFALVGTDRRTLTFRRSGILRTHRVQLTLDDIGDERTRLTAHGSAPLMIRRAFAELR
jgi:cobalamin biosynthesis protein CbiG